MTTEGAIIIESEKFADTNYNSNVKPLTKEDMAFAFQVGAKWAYNSIKSPWVNVEDKLPCDDNSLLRPFYDYVYETKKVFVQLKNGTVKIAHMFQLYPYSWEWSEKEVTHWMPIPEISKDSHWTLTPDSLEE